MKIPLEIKEVGRYLRNNMTKSEIILWNYIKNEQIGCKFLRQKPLYLFTEFSGFNRFIIPDFLCFDKKIIIEVDGSIHKLKEVYFVDIEKEKLLQNLGYKVIRITNYEINNNILDVIKYLKTKIN